MRKVKAKKIRKLADFDLKAKRDYRYKPVKKMVYEKDSDGKTVAKEVEKRIIVNASKLRYKQFKKIYKNTPRKGRLFSKEETK